MQPWVDRHPILFILSFVVFVYLTTSLVVSWWSGWAVLARQFRLRSRFTGSRWRGQSGLMRWLCGYGNCLTVGANSEGLYLATLPFFPLFHPPLFIPWNEVLGGKEKTVFCTGSALSTGKREYPSPCGYENYWRSGLEALLGAGILSKLSDDDSGSESSSGKRNSR